jgi:hypothetical protein
MNETTPVTLSAQGSQEASRYLVRQYFEFLVPLLRDFDRRLDHRRSRLFWTLSS